MTSFVTKEVLNRRSVGDTLRAKRLEFSATLEQVSTATGVGAQYLQALEEDRFERLPGSLYAKQFIRRYAEYLGIDEQAQALFDRIQRLFPVPTLLKQVSLKDLMVFSTMLRYGTAFGVVGIMLAFALAQVYTFVTPPDILGVNPVSFTNHRLINIAGTTKNAQTVVVNNEEVPVDNDGYFRATVPLMEGINTLSVVATNRRNQETIHYATVYFAREPRQQRISAR